MTTNNSLNNESLSDFSVINNVAGESSTVTVNNTSNTASSVGRVVLDSSAGAFGYSEALHFFNGDSSKYVNFSAATDSIGLVDGTSVPSSDRDFGYKPTGEIERDDTTAFKAYLGTTQNNVTGDNTDYAIPLATESFDVGNNFNTGTSVFTARVTGRYLFTGIVRIADSTGNPIGTASARLHVNGTEAAILISGVENNANASDELSLNVHQYVDLAANDTIELGVRVDSISGGKVIDVLSGSDNTFLSGILIG